MAQFIAYSIGVFLVVIILLVIILLVAKKYLSPSGNVNITVNGDKVLNVPQGNNLMATLNQNGIFLPSACGGKASCGQCKVQVLEGGGEILDSEKPHFTRKQIKDHWRLGCQCKVKGDLKIHVDESILGVKEYECTVPAGEHMDFLPGSYAQIKIPKFDCIDYDKDIDKSLIGDEYLPSWEKFGLFPLKCKNPEDTIRAYSMANYPAEGDVFMLTVRIRLEEGDDLGWWWCRYGSAACSDHAHDQDAAHHRSRDALLLWCSRAQRGVLSRGLPRLGEGVSQLPLPSGSRSSRPCSRCSWRKVHSGLRPSGHAEHLSERPRGSRGYRVLHVRSWPNVEGRGIYARLARCRSRVNYVR